MSFENWNRFVAETLKQTEKEKEAKKQGAQGMNEKAKEARRAYKREWNRKNRDKVKAAQERYWIRKAMKDSRNQQAEKDGEV